MPHPKYSCPECGHRLFSHIEGGVFCPDCGFRDEDIDGLPDGK